MKATQSWCSSQNVPERKMGKVCRVKQRTTVYKKRIGFRGNKSKVTEDVSNVVNVPINTVNIESDTSVNNVNIESNTAVAKY